MLSCWQPGRWTLRFVTWIGTSPVFVRVMVAGVPTGAVLGAASTFAGQRPETEITPQR